MTLSSLYFFRSQTPAEYNTLLGEDLPAKNRQVYMNSPRLHLSVLSLSVSFLLFRTHYIDTSWLTVWHNHDAVQVCYPSNTLSRFRRRMGKFLVVRSWSNVISKKDLKKSYCNAAVFQLKNEIRTTTLFKCVPVAFSTLAVCSSIFHSSIFHPWNFARIAFSTPKFSVPLYYLLEYA